MIWGAELVTSCVGGGDGAEAEGGEFCDGVCGLG